MSKELRADITGLRAIAVVSVAVYHLMHVFFPHVNFFQGGFLGVDIFFVISGYLMTMIIVKGIDNGNFSLYNFYSRRAKRICPALFVTVIFFAGLGYLLLGDSDLKRMAGGGLRSLFFFYNQFLARKTDYFGNQAVDMPFLHMWSLCVEWQFYLFYPLLVMVLRRFLAPKMLPRVILLITAISAFYAAYYVEVNPRSAYYILPSRAFELTIGGLAYFYPLSFFQNFFKVSTTNTSSLQSHRLDMLFNSVKPWAIELLGLIIIAISLVVVNDDHGWPSLWALVPLFGAYLCIAANNKKSLLRNIVFQKLGLWSYALYLVHWPLIIFAAKLGLDTGVELFIPILLLGMLLHYSVERRRNYGYIFLCIYLVGSGALYFLTIDGAKYRLQNVPFTYAQYGGGEYSNHGEVVAIGDLNRKPDFILAGDSFARQYAFDLVDRGLHVITVFSDGCYSYDNNISRFDGKIDDKCVIRYANTKAAAKRYPDIPIVFAQNWPHYDGMLESHEGVKYSKGEDFYKAINDDIKAVANDFAGRKVYILATPLQTIFDIGNTCMNLKALENPLARFVLMNSNCGKSMRLDSIPLNERLKDIINKLPQNTNKNEAEKAVTFIDPSEAYCIDGNCEVLVGNSIRVFSDGRHFSWAGSVKVTSYILNIIGVEQGRVRTSFEDDASVNQKEGIKSDAKDVLQDAM